MPATTSDSGGALRGWVWAVLCLVAAAGLTRLQLDPQAALRLPPQDPVESADRMLREATGSDDVVAVVLRRDDGALTAEGIAAVDAVYSALTAEPSLMRTRSLTRAPVLGGDGGVLTAKTPLHPLPAPDAFEAALRTVLKDRFAVGTLISPDGSIAVLPSWIRRDSASTLLVEIASKALQDEATRATEHGGAAKRAIDEARLAVLLGNADGPANAEVGRRLGALADAGNTLVSDWSFTAAELAAEPDKAALAAAEQVLARVSLPKGLTGTVIGAAAVEASLSAAYPVAIGLLLLGLLVGVGLSGWRQVRSARPAIAALGSAGFVAGGMGWLGVPMHGMTALLPPLAVLLSGAAATSRTAAARTGAALLPLIALALASAPTPGLTQGLLLCVAAVLGVGFALTPECPSEVEPGPHGLRSSLVAGLIAAALVGSQPVGFDPAGLLDRRAALGATMGALDSFGMATPAQLAFAGEGARALATPEGLNTLAGAQRAVEAHDGIASTVSWADFVQALHHAVSGADGLPSDPALVDQYLLLFGRPDDVRPLVAPDFHMGGGLVRLAPGQGARVGQLAGPVADGPVVLTGAAARVSRAGWLSARRALAGAGAGLAIALLVLLLLGAERRPRSPVIAACAAVVAVGVTSLWAGAVGIEAALAGSVVWALCVLGSGPMLWAGTGGVVAILSPVVPVAAFGLGLGSGALTGAVAHIKPGTLRAR